MSTHLEIASDVHRHSPVKEILREPESGRIVTGVRDPMHEWAVILAGGDGMRLRELAYQASGDRRPKQFCSFFGGKTLLEHTRARLHPLFLEENTLLVLNRTHEAFYPKDLCCMSSRRKLIQPSNRGTAPAIALAVMEVLRRDPAATIAIFPSDHHYVEGSIFQATVERALQLAKTFEGQVLIVGASATYPEVEYGWIEPGLTLIECPVNPVQYGLRFWEKPNLSDASVLLSTGCMWNTFVTIGTGHALVKLFAATASHLLDALSKDFSEASLDRIYSELGAVDFSKDVLSSAVYRLLVVRDAPSGWTDFGSPQRALSVLKGLGHAPPEYLGE
jgi:mannose-1-phosphate guanylyltransferase